MSLRSDFQDDNSNTLLDMQEPVVFQRKAFAASSAGEETGTWSTSCATQGEVQWKQDWKRGDVRAGGFSFSPEADVFLRFGANVLEGDRTHLAGFTMYVQEVRRDPDKLKVVVTRRSKDQT